MHAAGGKAIIALLAVLVLSACGNGGDPQLMNLRSGSGPDEFGIVPPKPLAMPESLTELPEPTPGGTNRTDRNPEEDAAIALGGKPGAAGGIPSGDSALFAHAARFGMDASIRSTLAAEDLQWRRDNQGRILERLFNVNVYYKAYREQSLDQHAELARWRLLGLRTPSAPPPKQGE
ncbi:MULTISPECIES: DUF3035 domain-containing protein [Tabrizicola]|uniref:DUF3035 domain-containing protein n=1 Tax=Tabrizicola TaxID=1443919 RepID=UPI0010810A59|nr:MULTISPECIES: DUF3035 domain-containing protein [Paracoccaceae]